MQSYDVFLTWQNISFAKRLFYLCCKQKYALFVVKFIFSCRIVSLSIVGGMHKFLGRFVTL